MVRSKVSEYQHAYKGADPSLQADFLEKSDYVAKRRLRESYHIQSPFQWDVLDSTDLDYQVKQVAEQFKEKVQLVPERCSPQSKKPAIRKIASIDSGRGTSASKKSSNKAVQVDDYYLEPKNSSFGVGTPPRSKSATPTASSYFRSYRPFVNNLPRVRRPSSVAVTTSTKCYHIHECASPEEEVWLDGILQPHEFSPYAAGNKTRRVSGKRTFNVRADHGVYSTALRASANRSASQAYTPPSSAPYGSPGQARRRGVPCAYSECRCSKNY